MASAEPGSKPLGISALRIGSKANDALRSDGRAGLSIPKAGSTS